MAIANRISFEKTLCQTILDSGIYGHERAFACLAGMMWLRDGLIYRIRKED